MEATGYFDGNATAPLHEVAREAWLAANLGHWHNASAPYPKGAAVRIRLDGVREKLAGKLRCSPDELVFNSGATEGNNHVLSEMARLCPEGKRVVVSSLEHSSVSGPARKFLGERMQVLPTLPDGRADLATLSEWLQDGGVYGLSLMAANNESGALQPWHDALQLCLEHGVVFHCDAAQWVGKMPMEGFGSCHFLTASAHKFGGPKGCGFMKVSQATGGEALIYGGRQEHGLRAGTEDYPSASAMVAALEASQPAGPASRDNFEAKVRGFLAEVVVLGGDVPRVPQTSLLLMPRHENSRWIVQLAKRGYSLSTGSACSSAKEGGSDALEAMGLPPDDLNRVLRVSGGFWTTQDDWEGLAAAIKEVWEGLEAEGKTDGVVRIP